MEKGSKSIADSYYCTRGSKCTIDPISVQGAEIFNPPLSWKPSQSRSSSEKEQQLKDGHPFVNVCILS